VVCFQDAALFDVRLGESRHCCGEERRKGLFPLFQPGTESAHFCEDGEGFDRRRIGLEQFAEVRLQFVGTQLQCGVSLIEVA
jgi:hypothetical protein